MNIANERQETLNGQGKKILIVEDEEAMAVALKDGIAFEGYRILVATDGEQGLRMAEQEEPDLIVLDVMLPKMNGLDICRRLRGSGNDVPIIFLTARGQEIDKVLGLKLGADDYLTKPFSLMELLARMETVLRRAAWRAPVNGETNPQIYRFGDVMVDFRKHEAHKNGQSLNMSPREFMMLNFFIQHRGEVVTRDQLLDTVWGYDSIPFTRTVDSHIAKLRKKIEDAPSDPRFLITVHRLGYKFTG